MTMKLIQISLLIVIAAFHVGCGQNEKVKQPTTYGKQSAVYILKLKKPDVLQNKRLASFKINLIGARFASMKVLPQGWSINVHNSLTGNSEMEGAIEVGVAAEDGDFIGKTVCVRKVEGADKIDVNIELELWEVREPYRETMLKLTSQDVVLISDDSSIQ